MMAEVDFRQGPKGVSLQIEEPPQGPLVVIEPDGTVTVTRGTQDEAAKLFWEAVNIHGGTYRQRILALEQTVMALSTDPYKQLVTQGGYDIWAALPKLTKSKLTHVDVSAVLETIDNLARKAIQ